MHTTSRKVSIKYVDPLVIFEVIDPHNYLLMTLDGKIVRGLFKHKRLKPSIIRTSQGNVSFSTIKTDNKYSNETIIISNLESWIYLLIFKISFTFVT